MNEKTGVIYRIYNRTNGKSYIGKTLHPEKRIRDHLNGRRSSVALQNAIKKYGKGSFVVELLEQDMPESWLSKLEILHIRFFNSKNNGYNLTDGGEGTSGYTFSPEELKKMSDALKGKTSANKGKTLSPETRQRMSEAQKGKIISVGARQKISAANKGEKNGNYNKKHSLENRLKISKAHADRHKRNRQVEYTYYLSLPPDMPVEEKRKRLREQFPNKRPNTIWRWLSRWELE